MRSLAEKAQQETRWCYISGSIKALEKDLIPQPYYQTMVSSQHLHDLLRSFSDTYYKGLFRQEEDLFHYDAILNAEVGERFGWIKKNSPQPFVHDLFKIRIDLQNLKVGMKAYVSRNMQDKAFDEEGIMKEVPAASLSSGFDEIPVEYEDALRAMTRKYMVRKNLQSIDFEADRQMLTILYRMAQASENDLIKQYVYTSIDLKNLCALWRLKAMGQEKGMISNILFIHPESQLTMDVMEELFERDHNKWAPMLATSGYEEIFSLEKGMVHGTTTLVEIERKCDDFLTGIVRRAKYVPFGIEVVLGYLAGFLTEVVNIKIIIVAKLNHLSDDVIKAKLRQVYV